MTEQIELIRTKLDHLSRMHGYLQHSLSQVEPILQLKDWAGMGPDQHESLAAFRLRFSEFQEHLGKTMRSVAIEEEQDVDRLGAVLAFMERLKVIDSADHWKVIRELRNAVNHEYQGDGACLAEFFELMVAEMPTVFRYFTRLHDHCRSTYGLA